MTETTDPGGSDPAPADPTLPDRLPPDGRRSNDVPAVVTISGCIITDAGFLTLRSKTFLTLTEWPSLRS
jgi:hypothetical protein